MEKINPDTDPRDVITDEIEAEIRKLFQQEADQGLSMARQTFTIDVFTADRLPLDVIAELGSILANFAYHWLTEDGIKTWTAFLTCDIEELNSGGAIES
jgi:hypothetical protein